MSSVTNYYGLNVVTPYPTGPGGSAIQANFESLVQWSPKSSSYPTTQPTVDNDSTSLQNYNVLSMWLTVNSPPTTPSQLYICSNPMAGSAVWNPIVLGDYYGNLSIDATATTNVPLVITGNASNSVPFVKLTDGTVSAGIFIGSAENAQFGTITDHPVLLYANNGTVLTLTAGGMESNLNFAFNGTANTLGKVSNYGTVNTAGNGLAAIVADGRMPGATGAISGLVSFTPVADGLFVIQANILVTTATSHSFTMTVSYTDEGNTARTVTVPFILIAFPNTIMTSIDSTYLAVPYMGIPLTIRCKGATTVTVQTTGTFTAVTYNAEAVVTQVD